jgi:glycerophosphoryl diester phosphodiesterase
MLKLRLMLALLLTLPPASRADDAIRLIAHRGGVVDYFHPENSLGSAQVAAEQGYWMIEIDLQETTDGRIVVHHDDFKKSFGVEKWPGQMSWAEVSRLTAAEDKSAPPEFKDLAALCRGRLQLMMDIKPPHHSRQFYETVERIMRDNGLLQEALFIGTDEARAWFKGKARVSIGRADLQRRLDAGEDPAHDYFLFEHGTTLDEAGMALARRAGVPVVVSINQDHYRPLTGDRAKAARADVEKTMRLGVRYWQIDSVYVDRWLQAEKAP